MISDSKTSWSLSNLRSLNNGLCDLCKQKTQLCVNISFAKLGLLRLVFEVKYHGKEQYKINE